MDRDAKNINRGDKSNAGGCDDSELALEAKTKQGGKEGKFTREF